MKEDEALSTIENDEFYKQFLEPSEKKKLESALSITEQVKKLGDGIEILSRELQTQVLENHDDLLRQASHATRLENVLETMNMHVQNLFANAERLKAQIHGPYNILENHTRILGRLHLASHILRRVNRIQQLNKRLANTNDPIQKAALLQELEQLAADPDLMDIEAVTSELRNIRVQQQKIVNLTTSSLSQGITNENVTQTATALQIFINLGTVKEATQKVVDMSLSECEEILKSCFDITGGTNVVNKSKSGSTSRSTLQNIKTRLWSDLEKAFSEELFYHCRQIKFLQSSIDNLDGYDLEIDVAARFWVKLGQVISEQIKNASDTALQMLEEDYPKLLKYYYEMIQRLGCAEFTFNRSILEKCENTYLSNSLTKLLEPTQSMFGTENVVPKQERIDSLVRIVAGELSVTLVEENLSEKTAKNVSKCIKMYAVKTEQLVATGPEAAQVIGGSANSGQRLNVQLANSMFYFHTQIQRILLNMKESLPLTSASIITDSLQSLDVLMAAIVQPLVESINQTVETIIVTIHQESDWTTVSSPSGKSTLPSSPYMRELTQFLTRAYQTYLSDFENKEILNKKCNEIAVRCIELLATHSALLRPISSSGRIRLRSDYQHLERALKVLCPQLSDLGKPYRLFKSMATLVALTPDEIVKSQESGSVVPSSTILLLLFSFAGSDLASPHHNMGWSVQKLSAWLDEHESEIERLDLIAGALQRYETLVRQKQSANYDPVYPVMCGFLEKALKNNK